MVMNNITKYILKFVKISFFIIVFIINVSALNKSENKFIISSNRGPSSVENTLTQFFSEFNDCSIIDYLPNGRFQGIIDKLKPSNVDNYQITLTALDLIKSSDIRYIRFGNKEFDYTLNKDLKHFDKDSIYSKRKVRIDEKFKSRLEKLSKLMSKKGINKISQADIVSHAFASYQAQQNNGEIGECYYAFEKIKKKRDVLRFVELDLEVQAEMESYFMRKGQHYSHEDSLRINDKTFSFEEIRELRAIRAATRLFEQSSFLKNDKGGWTGNHLSLANTTLWCGEEARTMSSFLLQLEEKGLLKEFTALPLILLRWVALGLNNHAASPIMNKRTGDIFIVDSWQDNGGSSARILTLQDWLNRDDYKNVVDLILFDSK